MSGLPTYNAEATCPKCGHDQIHSSWKANAHTYGCREHVPKGADCCTLEHIDRRCTRCGYGWPEAPIGGAS